MGTKVPLCYYDPDGTRHVIGEADAVQVAGEWIIAGRISDPRYLHLVRDDALKEGAVYDYSIGFDGSVPVEAAQIPEPVIPKDQ